MSSTPNTPVTIPRSQVVDFTSTVNGRSYRLMISAPHKPAPLDGYPVLWVLDGQGYHGFMTDASRNRSCVGAEIDAPLVVSVGYPDDDPGVWLTRRWLDLSPTPPSADMPVSPAVAAAGGAGDVEGFLNMLQTEAMPKIGALFSIDRGRMALWGHSLGGLATLHALFTRPTLFQSFLAISPSIAWNNRVVLSNEATFAQKVEAGEVAPRVFISVGGLEETPPSSMPAGAPMTVEEIRVFYAKVRMVSNARELFERLSSLRGRSGYTVRFTCPANETHITVPYSELRPALDLAFAPEPPKP